jgi:hypothetical protein
MISISKYITDNKNNKPIHVAVVMLNMLIFFRSKAIIAWIVGKNEQFLISNLLREIYHRMTKAK